jgi:catalase
MLTFVYSDMGTPANFRQMDGFGVHAFKWVNASGDVRYVKYTWKSMQGHRNLTAMEAKKVVGEDWGQATTDLYANIEKGNYPSWELYVQMMSPEDLDKFDFNPLDATKIWPEKLIPARKVGKMTLNKMPENFFEETEQSAFAPGNLVPGIEASEDRLLQGRLFAYFDTQRYRLGANFQQLPINRPKVAVHTNNQNGALATRGLKSDVNYEPSVSTDGLTDTPEYQASRRQLSGTTLQKAITKQDNFAQAGELYRSFSEADKANLISNLAGDLGQVKNRAVQVKMLSYFYRADADYGTRLAGAINIPLQEVKAAASAIVTAKK